MNEERKTVINGIDKKNKTIRRNQIKRTKEIFSSCNQCIHYSLHNSFDGQKCDPAAAQKDWEQFAFARLIEHGDGRYTVVMHSNSWYELQMKGEKQ